VDEVRHVLRRAGRRLWGRRALSALVLTLSIALAALIAAMLAERLLGLGVDWPLAFAGALAGAVVAAAAAAAVVRPGLLAVAREVDERAGLRESLSTALCVSGREDGWSANVVDSARRVAARVVLRDAVPVSMPARAPLPLALAFALALLWFVVPQFDLLGAMASRERQAEEMREVVTVRADVQAVEQRLRDMLRSVPGVEMPPETPPDQGPVPAPTTPDEIRREAIKRLTGLSEQLAGVRSGEKGRQMDALRDRMMQLRQPGPGPLEPLAAALQRADAAQARQELDHLARKMGDGSMSEAERERLAAQMRDLAAQLERLAADRRAMERELLQLGLGAEEAARLAADPAALREALARTEGLSDAQKQALLEQARASEACQGACTSMAQSLGRMGEQAGEMSGGELAALDGALGELEMLQAELAGAEAALNEARIRLAELASACAGAGDGDGGTSGAGALAGAPRINPWREGDERGRGMGSGGPGQGMGWNVEAREAPFETEKRRSTTKKGAGPVIASRLVFGDVMRGEATAEFADAVRAGADSAAEALETMRIPRELQDAVQHYFGGLSRRAGEQPPPEDAR
jgi:hypothetical protein